VHRVVLSLNQIMKTHLDLFSGIGGFALAAQWNGMQTVGFCEIEPFAQKVLTKNFPFTPIHTDVRNTEDFIQYEGKIDLLTGGYPCQPFSVAGNQKAAKDDRHLWPAMFEIIKLVRPSKIICENVLGHIKLGLDKVLHDLESIGYTARPFIVPALAIGVPHNRGRIYIVADSSSDGFNESSTSTSDEKAHGRAEEWPHKNRDNEGRGGLRTAVDWRCQEAGRGGIESTEIRVDDGLPNRMDRARGLGNAIVPQVAAEIIRAMMQTERPTAI